MEFPEKKDNIEFVQYSVFDSQSVKVHLEENNKLNFTPSGFEFFEKAIKLYEGVSQKLQEEIADKRPANEYLKHFNNDNDIQSEITGLGVETDFEKLNVIGSYRESDEESLTEFISESEKLKVLDIPKKMTELQKLQDLLTKFTAQQKETSDFLKQENIESYKLLISLLQKNRNLAAQEGVDSLNAYQIESMSSNEWREFIKASKSYASAIEKSRGTENEYPSDSDNCLFCLQPLMDKENVLIKSYWKLLKSEAEAELKRTTYKIEDIEKKLKELSPVKFNEATTLFQYVNETAPDLAKKWKDIVSSIESTQKNLITNLSNQNWELPISPCVASISEFDLIAMKITDSIEDLRKKNPVKEIEELEIKINYLKDKCLLNKLLEQITQFVSSHKWAEKAERAVNSLNTRSVTSQQGKLFSQHVTESYTNHFNSECEKLNAPKVVDIVQKNSKATSLRKLQVAGNVASNILSEGEQRAISLADFLTETHLNPRNNGLFFDDPVTSQDHHRREKIATRLVEISAHKQIVVFTHDIAFFTRLKLTAEKLDINHHYTTIRKSGGLPGIISPELPWIVQPVKKRVGTLRDRLVKLKKIELKANEDEYLFEAKSWYGLLREAWERVVEERLFKGVVERFSIGIQTQKLKKLCITSELISEIENGMTESSSWLHDAAAGLNPTPPDCNKAEKDLSALNDFIKKCVPA